jgi:casein kinase 1
VHIIDFGLAKKFIDERTGKHITTKKGKIPIGAPRYRSINMMKGLEIGRADDCESVMYMLTEFASDNELPWAQQGGVVDHDRILHSKIDETLTVACKGLP